MYCHADGRLAGYEGLYEDEYLEGIFGTIFKGIKGVAKVGFGAAKGFVTGGPTGAITGGIRTVIPKGKGKERRMSAGRQRFLDRQRRQQALVATPAPRPIVPLRPVAPPPSPYAPRAGQYYMPPPMMIAPPSAMNQFLIPAALVGAALLMSRR